MTKQSNLIELPEPTAPMRSRADLSRLLRDLAAGMGADGYLLAETVVERSGSRLRILCSNWVYDAIEELGLELISRIVADPASAPLGARPQVQQARNCPFLSPQQVDMMLEHGHAEFCSSRLVVDRRRLFVLFSSGRTGGLDAAAAPRAQMMLYYALDRFSDGVAADAVCDPLSERERECLVWVSEGKTTDEVALILGVSANTINNYVANAIQKFGAANRAMAIAAAIRGGII